MEHMKLISEYHVTKDDPITDNTYMLVISFHINFDIFCELRTLLKNGSINTLMITVFSRGQLILLKYTDIRHC